MARSKVQSFESKRVQRKSKVGLRSKMEEYQKATNQLCRCSSPDGLQDGLVHIHLMGEIRRCRILSISSIPSTATRKRAPMVLLQQRTRSSCSLKQTPSTHNHDEGLGWQPVLLAFSSLIIFTIIRTTNYSCYSPQYCKHCLCCCSLYQSVSQSARRQ